MAEQISMNPARILSWFLPALLAVCAALIANLPVSLTGGLVPSPVLALAPIYFWTLVRPDLMPPAAVLTIGLLEDLLSGGPPGLWAAGFLAAFTLADRQRDVFAGLAGTGAVFGFAASMFTASAIVFVLVIVVLGTLPPLAPIFLQATVSVILYPLLAVLMGWVHRHWIGAQRGDE